MRNIELSDAVRDKKKLISLLAENLSINYSLDYPCLEKANRYWNDMVHFIKNRSAILIGAYDDSDSLVGLLWAYRKPDDVKNIFITHFVVDGHFRNRGIGTKLFDKLIQIAREESVNAITLTATCSNESAISFYEKCGFYSERVSMRKDID